MMKLRMVAALTAGSFLVAIAAAAETPPPIWQTQGVSENEIVIGTHTDLSSFVASFGVPTTNAAIMRIDEANEAGGVHGRKLRFIVEDAQYQVPKAVQAGNKLINRDQIFVMVGALGVAQNNAVLVQQLKAGVPNLFPNTVARQMYEPLHPQKFSLFAPYYNQVRAGVKYMVEQKGKRAVCAMYQDNDFGRELLEGVTDQVEAMGMKLVEATSHKASDQDFTANMTRMRQAGCDLIVSASIVRDTILAYSTARRMDWQVDMMGTSASYDATVAGAKDGLTDGYYTMGHVEPLARETASPQVVDWMDRYKAKFGHEPTIAAALGYVIMDVTVQALAKAGRDLTTRTLIDGVESIDGYRDIFGGPPIGFSATKHLGSTQSMLFQVQNGRWVRITDPIDY